MIDFSGLAARHGTPLYVYDLAAARQALDDLRACVPPGTRIYYSLKANPHPDLVRALLTAGCHAEVSSVGELDAALGSSGRAADCLYTGPGKPAKAIAHAIAAGVGEFSAESIGDLRRIADIARDLGRSVDCLLRINGSAASGGSGLRMTGTASQFGIDFDQVARVLEDARGMQGARIRGAHLFPITNAATEEALIAELCGSIGTAAALREGGLPMELLDLGGGFAAPYARPGAGVRYQGIRQALTTRLDETFAGWRAGQPRLAVESGRFLVGNCGTLVTTVLDIKHSHGRGYAVLDAGINHLGGLSGLRRLLPMSAQPVRSASAAQDSPEPGVVDLAGPLCTPVDLLGTGVELPGLRIGDVLPIPNVGAYGLTASLLGFLSHPAPVEVVVDGAETVSVTRLRLHRLPV